MAAGKKNFSEELTGWEDEEGIIHSATIENGEVGRYEATALPKDAVSDAPIEEKRTDEELVEPPDPRDPRQKIHPLLQRWLDDRPDDRATVVVSFRDDLVIPRFPEPDVEEPREHTENARKMERAEALAGEIERARDKDYRRLTERLNRHDAKILDTFWLIRAMSVDLPLKAVAELAEDEEVLYLQPEESEDAPPQDDVVDGRAAMDTDPYFNLGLTSGWIGLLDTGIRRTHVLFNSPTHIDFMRDCVNGGANCNTGNTLNPIDDCWNHGTSSAAIISANSRQGNAFRGVTAITLDSWKVYPSTTDSSGACTGFLSTTASVRAFENAVRVLDRVIVAEMQGSGGSTDAISLAADSAFDAGAVIIAANGNNGPGANTVNVPAVAHKVIGVGNFDVASGNQVASQSRGPAADNRFKPDIQAPTNTETASNASDSARRIFTGTSGATPYAAGAAALLRNWLRRPTGSIDPGQVYAQMILSGQDPYPFDNTSGAGKLQLPTNGTAWWGKVTVGERQNIDIPLSIARRARMLDAALWWPEGGIRFFGFELDWHSDVDLYLLDPGGGTRASSISIPSVFERARVTDGVDAGTWKLRIRGYRIPFIRPSVYWAAHVRF